LAGPRAKDAEMPVVEGQQAVGSVPVREYHQRGVSEADVLIPVLVDDAMRPS
jgi:hypothetical protein